MKLILVILLSVITSSAQTVADKKTAENFIRAETGQASVVSDIKCGTRYDLLIHTHPDLILPALRQAYLQKVKAEPVRQKSDLSPSGYFRLYWDESGSHAVPLADQSGNGIPDYIDSAAVIFEYVRQIQIGQMGYQAPPDQDGTPAVPYEIYFSSLNYYGITRPGYTDIESLPGINYTSYIEVDNDFYGFPTPGLAGLKVTAAHEYHHAVQLGYHVNWDDSYFFEMTSTWMEEWLYPDIDDYINYLSDFFNSVSNTDFTQSNGFYPYANSLYLQLISAQYGPEIVRTMWEKIIGQPALTAIKAALADKDDTWSSSLGEYGLWLYYTGDRAQAGSFFSDARYFPQIRIKAADEIRFTEAYSEPVTLVDNANRYLAFNHMTGLAVNIDAAANSLTAGLRGVTRFSYSPFYPVNNPILGYLADADTLVVVLSNAGDEYQDYTLSLSVAGKSAGTNVFPFPNPANISRVQLVRFQNVPSSASMYIYTINGKRVAVVNANGTSLIRTWDLTDEKGDLVKTGIYLFLVQNEGSTQTGKFSVLR